MAIIESKMRNTMAQQRLDDLLTIFIELTKPINIEEIIDESKILTPIQRRLPL